MSVDKLQLVRVYNDLSTLSPFCSNINMPRFSKKCSNPLHDDRVEDFHNIKLIDSRARGLAKVVNALKVP